MLAHGIFPTVKLHHAGSMATRSNRSDGESGSERANPRCGLPSAPPRMEAGGSPSSVTTGERAASYATTLPRLNAPGPASGSAASSDAGAVPTGVEPCGRPALRRLPACSRLSRASIPPGEVLAAACALLRHPPLRAETGTPEGEWLDELTSLVRMAAPGPKG